MPCGALAAGANPVQRARHALFSPRGGWHLRCRVHAAHASSAACFPRVWFAVCCISRGLGHSRPCLRRAACLVRGKRPGARACVCRACPSLRRQAVVLRGPRLGALHVSSRRHRPLDGRARTLAGGGRRPRRALIRRRDAAAPLPLPLLEHALISPALLVVRVVGVCVWRAPRAPALRLRASYTTQAAACFVATPAETSRARAAIGPAGDRRRRRARARLPGQADATPSAHRLHPAAPPWRARAHEHMHSPVRT